MSENQLSEAIVELAQQVKNLGNGSATSNDGHGAIEMHGMKLCESVDGIATALDGIADAIEKLAQAVETTAETK